MSYFIVNENKYLTTFIFTFSDPKDIEYVYETTNCVSNSTNSQISDLALKKMKLQGFNMSGKFCNSKLHSLTLTVPTLSLPKHCINQKNKSSYIRYLPQGDKLFILFDEKDKVYTNDLVDLQIHLKMSAFNDFEELPIDLTFEKLTDKYNKKHFYRLIMLTIYDAKNMNII